MKYIPSLDLVQISFADARLETTTVNIGYVVFENLIFHARRQRIILTQIDTLDAVAEIGRIAVKPFTILGVLQFGGRNFTRQGFFGNGCHFYGNLIAHMDGI